MVKRTDGSDGNRHREDFGRYYEEFEVGDVYEHRPGRTITKTDNIWFSRLTMNEHPLHFDDEYGKETEFGECLVAAGLTLSIVSGMSVTDLSYKTIAGLGWDDVRMTNPVFAGDTIYAESEVIEKRESESRPDDGIVTVRSWGFNQDDEEVISFERSMLIPKRGTDE